MTRASWLILALLSTVCGGFPRARAEAPLESYVVLVGSNQGGDGQRPLAYAEGDAERMAQLFAELGRTPPQNIKLLRQPTPAEVQAALAALGKQLALRR